MAVSLIFHIVFACIGMVMPFFMATSYRKYLKSRDPEYLRLTKMWMKGVAIFFVVGAVSGTMLSFQLGLLWPNFMEHAGPIFGLPFSYEGAAFFLEAIALGIFLYGFDRVPERIHWLSSVAVGVLGVCSGILVVAANSWMNAPAGFDFDPATGIYSNIDPLAAMFNEAWFAQALHMTLAAFCATSAAAMGLHAILILKGYNRDYNLKAIRIVAPFFIIATLLQPLSGDISAKDIAKRQPEKLAAMEAHYHTEKGAGLLIGGIPDDETQSVRYGIKIPKALSFLAFGDLDAEVKGLAEFPADERPPVLITHIAFQVMVGLGSFLALVAALLAYRLWRKKPFTTTILRLLAFCTPLGYIALEAGWFVTELGRQPWIIYKVMKTADAVTPMTGMVYSFALFTSVYVLLAIIVTWLFSRQIKVYQEPQS